LSDGDPGADDCGDRADEGGEQRKRLVHPSSIRRARANVRSTAFVPVPRPKRTVSTRLLADRAGVTPSVVHYHFGSVQALLVEAVLGAGSDWYRTIRVRPPVEVVVGTRRFARE
jgi:hypothetical protein